ncbi:MAG TPA: ATP-binding protein [Candidatus Kapabacteria bacterium]|nr:ATP-binding protein [Candidatus Kapabacteria bacterium]
MKKDILKQMIVDFHRGTLPQFHPRHLKAPVGSTKIISIIGARRSGKTFYLYQLMAELLNQNCEKTHLLYINFEDERLDFNREELDLILQAYRELYPGVNLQEVHFFFDEIQNIDGWDKFIRRIYESLGKNIYITGSNSKLLGKEISTSLRGRALSYELFPLSFNEYLEFHHIEGEYVSSAGRALIRSYFHRFLRYGGFPELATMDESLYDKTLQEYYNTMIFRDLVERYEIKQIHVLKYFLKRLLNSITKDISVNKIFNELKSQGIKVGKNLLYEFMDSVEAIYLMIILLKYNESVIKQEFAEKKTYCIDNGLLNAVTFHYSGDKGKLLENAIGIELLKQGQEVFFYRDNVECDFLLAGQDAIRSAIQVCMSLIEPETRRREIKGLTAACKRFKLPKGIIITDDEEETILDDNIEIKVIPAFKFLLEFKNIRDAA